MQRLARLVATQPRTAGPLPIRLLVTLLAPAVLLVLAGLAHWAGSPAFASTRWDVNRDRSFVEIYGYVQVLSAAALLLLVHRRRRGSPVYVGWAVALSTVVLDDALEWHERVGYWLSVRTSVVPPPGLRAQDLGELTFWALLGAAVLLVLWATHVRSDPRAQTDSWRLGGIIVLLMVFAVGVDMFDIALSAVTTSTRLELLVSALEAEGEVVAMVLLLVYVLHVLRRPVPARG